MAKTATCDQCNASITEGDGYVFYSTAGSGVPGAIQETGNMFMCEECTNKICSTSGFAKKMPDAQEISGADFLADPMKMLTMMKDANRVSIVKRCKAHGFSPAQAKAKAHEFATIWWQDPEKAQLKSANFWKSGGSSASSDSGGGGCFIATACYGSYDHPDVLTLRSLRDHVLLVTAVGKRFVSAYYRVSPSIVNNIGSRRWLLTIVRLGFIRPIVRLLRLFR